MTPIGGCTLTRAKTGATARAITVQAAIDRFCLTVLDLSVTYVARENSRRVYGFLNDTPLSGPAVSLPSLQMFRTIFLARQVVRRS